MANNHPLFGICLHSRFHPVKRCVRFVSLIGSILFGVAVTNIIYLTFVHYDQDYDKAYAEVSAANAVSVFGVDGSQLDQNVQKHTALVVTNGNVALWTVGAALHAVYDNIVWALATCACCATKMGSDKMNRFQTSGAFLVILFVIVVTALATFAVAIRFAVEDVQEGNDKADEFGLSTEDLAALKERAQVNEFGFLIAYGIELALTFFVFYPIVGTILFTGCLACGRTRLLGGRPYELKREAEEDNDVEQNRKAATQRKPEQPPEAPRRAPPRGTAKGQGAPNNRQNNARPAARQRAPQQKNSPKHPGSQPTKKTTQSHTTAPRSQRAASPRKKQPMPQSHSAGSKSTTKQKHPRPQR